MRRLIILLCFIVSSFTVNSENFPKSVQKKIDKVLLKLFSKGANDLKSLDLDEEAFVECPSVKNLKIFSLKTSHEGGSYICFASSKAKNDYFDYMVIFDADLLIQNVTVLTYLSTYGGEITSRSWLKQFVGKTKGEFMEMDKDIDSISGATLSAPAITQGIKELSLLVSMLKAENKI